MREVRKQEKGDFLRMIKSKELVLKQDKFIVSLISQKTETESLRDRHFRQGQ